MKFQFLLFILVLHLVPDQVCTSLDTTNINIKRHHSFYLSWLHLMDIFHMYCQQNQAHEGCIFICIFTLYLLYKCLTGNSIFLRIVNTVNMQSASCYYKHKCSCILSFPIGSKDIFKRIVPEDFSQQCCSLSTKGHGGPLALYKSMVL